MYVCFLEHSHIDLYQPVKFLFQQNVFGLDFLILRYPVFLLAVYIPLNLAKDATDSIVDKIIEGADLFVRKSPSFHLMMAGDFNQLDTDDMEHELNINYETDPFYNYFFFILHLFLRTNIYKKRRYIYRLKF